VCGAVTSTPRAVLFASFQQSLGIIFEDFLRRLTFPWKFLHDFCDGNNEDADASGVDAEQCCFPR